MTDEELRLAIEEINESLENLPESDEKVPRRRRRVLLLKKEVLQKIQEAKEKNNHDQEFYNTVYYGILNTWGEKHLFLASLAMSRVRWGVL